MLVFINRGAQYRPQNIIVLLCGPQKFTPNFRKPPGVAQVPGSRRSGEKEQV